jgi:hypothetical protein
LLDRLSIPEGCFVAPATEHDSIESQYFRDLLPEGWHLWEVAYKPSKVSEMLRHSGIDPIPGKATPSTLGLHLENYTLRGAIVNSGYIEFEWKGEPLMFFTRQVGLSHWIGLRGTNIYALASPTIAGGQQFLEDLYKWESPFQGTILRFYSSEFYPDADLKRDIENFTWDSVVLSEELREDLLRCAKEFFAPDTKDRYKKLGIAHKRGVLLAGPPGCGKSLICKAVANEVMLPFLYVTNLQHHNGAAGAIEEIFSKARKLAPCVLCFEDLDSLITENVRTIFLNAMDGFGGMNGVLTLATTNHPEKIDPALLNRPSRFDRKVVIPYPAKHECEAYLLSRFRRMFDNPLSDDFVKAIATFADTESGSFSFAMLQEIVTSMGFRLARDPSADVIEQLRKTLLDSKEQLKVGEQQEIKKAIAKKPKYKGGLVI